MTSAVPPAWSHVPEFGVRLAGREYPDRPGAYAVLFDAERRLAVVVTPEGCFLPGGGADAGESAEQTLRREVAEECGVAVAGARPLGVADELVRVLADNRCFRKRGTFFVGQVGERLAIATEPDHVTEWLPPAQAIERLTHESQKWVVRRVVEARS